jgi:AcrR family transcriptional regulator
MPRSFSESEREEIRRRLIDEGRALFLRFGLRKTQVAELAEAAGIAKVSFYHLFDSKEDLCMEIFELEELAMRTDIEQLLSSEQAPRDIVRSLIEYGLRFAREDSLLAVLRETGDYALLVRGVDRETLNRHIDNDLILMERLIDSLEARGVTCTIPPDELAGVFRGIVMLSMHQDEIGVDVFEPAMERLMDWIAEGIVRGD